MITQSSLFKLNWKVSLAVFGTIAHTAAIKPSMVNNALVSMPVEFMRCSSRWGDVNPQAAQCFGSGTSHIA